MRSAAKYAAIVLAFVSSTAGPAYAHHEAIFGPQSSAVLSPSTFFSAQVFDKEEGEGADKHRETSTVFSVGFKPIKKRPLSLAFVVPMTFASSTADAASHHGFEDALVTARYQVDTEPFASSSGFEEGYVMGVGGLELPTGTIDHPFGKGGYGQIAAGLLSLEKKPLALLGYVYYHHRNEYEGERDSGNVFGGGGIAYTPIDEESRLFSLQLGISWERTFASELNGVALGDSGGSGVFLQPGVVFQFTSRAQFFALVSVPVTQQWNSADDHQRFRLGSGIIWIFK